MTVKKPTAFSLIELSIVIVIVSILLTGTLSFSVNNATTEKTKVTNERIQEVYKAMGIYLARNGKLPCPAPINKDRTDSTYGVAATTCTAAPSSGSGYYKSYTVGATAPNMYYGMVPVQTLGLATTFAEDGFGTKLAYVTLSGFTSATTFGYGYASSATSKNYATDTTYDYTQTAVASYSPVRITIKEKPLSTAQLITNDAMFAIISYGPNKNGGWNANSTTQNTISTDDDEKENDIDAADSTTAGSAPFDGILISSSPNSDVFDDIVFWKTRDQMTLEFDLLSLVACDIDYSKQVERSRFCPGSTAGSACAQPTYNGYGAGSFDWEALTSVHYGEIAPAYKASGIAHWCASIGTYTKGTKYPSKRCGAFGLWEADTIDNCLN